MTEFLKATWENEAEIDKRQKTGILIFNITKGLYYRPFSTLIKKFLLLGKRHLKLEHATQKTNVLGHSQLKTSYFTIL